MMNLSVQCVLKIYMALGFASQAWIYGEPADTTQGKSPLFLVNILLKLDISERQDSKAQHSLL